MLTRMQTKHQVLNHVTGCPVQHMISDAGVEEVTTRIMGDREEDIRISTKHMCDTLLGQQKREFGSIPDEYA